METIVLATLHIGIWVNLYFCTVWNEAIKKARVAGKSTLSKPARLMFDAWMFFSGVMFLVSVVVIAGNAFFFLKRGW